ncbi:MAG: hypothetical protein JXJ22_04570 [Bacteroidales bacterium]|nr:hypothetical protein [Bacteroidales bacterium]
MKRTFFVSLILCITGMAIYAQAVYVDSNTGNDKNQGTKEAPVFSIQKAAEIIRSKDNSIYSMKINPGIYILDHHVQVASEKEMAGKRIVIEATILPDEPGWTPDKMPVIVNKAVKGEISISYHWVVSFLVEESHVSIRGIKFHGYFYPHTRYFPIARMDKAKTDLAVEQCMFVGEANISQIQSGIIAYDNEVKVDHCIFYKLRNAGVFFSDPGNGIKTGTSVTNSIIYGVSHVIWIGSPEKEFQFEYNIVSNCNYVFIKRITNTTKYQVENCIVVKNKYFTGIPDSVRLNPVEFEMIEKNVQKQGEISLILTGNDDKPVLLSVDEPLPNDYMHPVPGSPGYNLGAGLFGFQKK